jgi:hypothetical protein
MLGVGASTLRSMLHPKQDMDGQGRERDFCRSFGSEVGFM